MVCAGFGIGLFLVAEGVCRLAGWGRPDLSRDPFVGFSRVQPLFVPAPDGVHMITASSRRKHFPLETFARQKAPGAFRVFVLGGSTVQGNPYAKETAFPTWLKLSLEAAEPQRQWEVINCGGISYASYRLALILEECLRLEPDLVILCTGHNEFLEDRTYAGVKHAPAPVAGSLRLAARLHTFHLFHAAFTAETTPPPKCTILHEEVDPWLDYWDGLKVYHRDEAWRAGVVAHFELNLRRMVAMAQGADVPLLLVRPPSNLRDCPPFKSQHRDGLTEDVLQAWEQLDGEAVRVRGQDARRERELLEQMLALDDQYALTHYQLGHCCDELGDHERARHAYLQARELDICPLRMPAALEAALARVAEENGVPLIDAQAELASRSPAGIPGNDWLLDHVHPSIQGHQVIAEALMEVCLDQGRVRPDADWKARQRAAYAAQLGRLGPDYFRAGEIALAGLRAWTEGRASGPSIDYRLFGRAAATR
jgi:tetratricopeptide (TPR) repeat protein